MWKVAFCVNENLYSLISSLHLTTAEQEMFSRLSYEKRVGFPPELFEQRILDVDNIALEKYAEWFDNKVLSDYMETIKNLQQTEQSWSHEGKV